MQCEVCVTPCARVHVHCYAVHAGFVRCQTLANDAEQRLSRIKQTRWNESTKTKRFWTQDVMKISNRHSSVLKSQMESILNIVAEWVSLKEMNALQGACMLTSIRARERQCEELLTDLDDQVWRDLSSDWRKYLLGKESTAL